MTKIMKKNKVNTDLNLNNFGNGQSRRLKNRLKNKNFVLLDQLFTILNDLKVYDEIKAERHSVKKKYSTWCHLVVAMIDKDLSTNSNNIMAFVSRISALTYKEDPEEENVTSNAGLSSEDVVKCITSSKEAVKKLMTKIERQE